MISDSKAEKNRNYKVLVIYLCTNYLFDHVQAYNTLIRYIHMFTFLFFPF